MLRSWTLVLLAALPGCHLVFGHDPGSGSGSGDAASRLERGILDGLRREVGSPSDRDTRDLGTCSEPLPPEAPGFVMPCPLDSSSCPSTNLDCDALPAGTDPYKSCNELLYKQGFASDVFASGAWHAYSKHDSWRWSCGKISQTFTAIDDGTEDEASSAVATGLTLPEHYLVEARVTLGPKANREHWRVGVIGRVTDDQNFYFMGCSIWEDPHAGSNNPVPDPDVVMTLKSPANPGSNAWPYPHEKVDALVGSEGSSYTLQLWYTADIVKFIPKTQLLPTCTTPACPAVICRVCTESTCFHSGFTALYTIAEPLKSVPAGGGTVGVRTLNRAATFDYVRVHELKNP